jgi:hypothetical protein
MYEKEQWLIPLLFFAFKELLFAWSEDGRLRESNRCLDFFLPKTVFGQFYEFFIVSF